MNPQSQTTSATAPSGAGAPRALTLEQARRRILSQLSPVTMTERVHLRGALDRVLAEDQISAFDVPAHTNSAMDGFAVRTADLPADNEATFDLIGDAFAGHPFDGEIGAGQCVRIMTGGVMPRGSDTVVIQEDIRRDGNHVIIGGGHKPGQHVRQAGEDMVRGERVLSAGRRLRAADLGLLASLGIGEVRVRRRLRVAFFSTGDELRSLGEQLGEGDIYDSNRYTLHAMLSRSGVEAIDLGVVRDRPAELKQVLQTASRDADVVMTSGGVSVGAADHIRDVLAEVGEVDFWKVRIKPGKPIAFGRLGRAFFFGLPGNPVSTMVTHYQIVQPALDYMAGGQFRPPLTLCAIATESLQKTPGRQEFQRGCLEQGEDGELRVRSAAPQGSGILRSMSLADCFIVLPEESGPVAAGTPVPVQPFAALI